MVNRQSSRKSFVHRSSQGPLTRLLVLTYFIIGAIHQASLDLDSPIRAQTVHETISKGSHGRQHATNRCEGREFVQEQRQSRLDHHDGSEQRARVPTTLDDRFGVSGGRLVRRRHIDIFHSAALERAGTQRIRILAFRHYGGITSTYWSAGPEPGCVTRRLNIHRTCEKPSKRGGDQLGVDG